MKIQTRDTRALSSAELYDLRKRAVTAIRAGRSKVDVAATLGVSRQAVARWVLAAQSLGGVGLKPQSKGRPKGGKLNDWKAQRIVKDIIEHLPDHLGLPFFLWTREAIALFIKRRFKIRLSVWTVGRLLKRWGLTPQKPARRAYERDAKTVRKWLKDEYPKIQAAARRQNAIILWEDEMGLRSDSSVGRTYGLKGQTPIVPVTGKRFSCNLIAGISNRGKLFFMIFTQHFTAPIFLIFLKRLIKQVRRKVFLIADAHPAHRAGKTKTWLKHHNHKIRLYFLPPYSPDLNPSEFLNQDVKSNTIRRKRPKDQKHMMSNVRGYLRSRQRNPRKVASYFHAKTVRYAAC